MKTANEAIAAIRNKIKKRIAHQQTCIKYNYRLTGKAEEEIIYEYKILENFLNTLEAEEKDTFCKENCKGYQDTGRCFCDGGCEAKKQAEDTSLKIHGWVARDKDGGFWLHSNKPTRRDTDWFGMGFFQLCDNLFPDLKWEDEPIEVDLIVKPRT